MKIAYFTRIFNEERLIYYNLLYYYNLGIRNFFITFNNSNQETLDQANKFFLEKKDDAILHKFMESSTSYSQSEQCNIMSNDAYAMGFKWQIPADADELLILKKHRTVQDFIRQYAKGIEYGFCNLRWVDFNPSSLDDEMDNNYFTRWEYRCENPRPPSKIICKWHPECKWGDGKHLVIAKRNKIAEIPMDVGFYAHFVNREKEQIKKKRIRIGEAFIERYGPDSNKPQINEYRKWEQYGDKYFDEVWKNLQVKRENQFKNYIHDPIPKKMFR